ncbi:MAG: signal recognition particle-docking protein FtsY [Methanomicrobiaceae archaeon]|nr:signal recognition particle-docking protein FtsY [Methanomicrobiaceae archaeon]
MFGSLKDRLRGVKEKLGLTIESAAEAAPEGPLTAGDAPAPGFEEKAAGEEAQAPEEKAAKKTSTFTERVRVLVTDREVMLGEKDVAEPLQELEIVLLENDVALPVAEAIVEHMRSDLVGRSRKIGASVDTLVMDTLKRALLTVLGEGFSLTGYIDSHERPVKVLFTGVNGTGKTTTIAKIAQYLRKQGYSVVIGSGDTFRAGATEQMKTHADRVGVKAICHQEGADPSAVLFDTVQYATAHGIDVVLADTAGRFHNRANLMNQLEKIRRVMKPDLVVYVDEAVAGNDAVIRAEEFNNAVGTDAVVLTKADMDPRGGAAISIAHTIGKPVMFLGVGQSYDDVIPFRPEDVVDELLREEE